MYGYKRRKEKIIRTQIVSAAQTYSEQLAGKVFLYVYGEEYFEILFRTDHFMHLTGVASALHAKKFYKYSKEGKLTTEQFYFTKEQPYAGAKKKLPCLNRLPELTNNMVCVLKDLTTVTLTYKLGLTNLEFTLGLTENRDNYGNIINDFLLPRTLRVKDKAIERSLGGEIVDFIFVRDGASAKYSDITYADKTKTIPESIFGFLDSHFIEQLQKSR